MEINFFDTANVYSIGKSEEILGRALKDFAKRDEVIIATKVRGKMRDGANGEGLSRKSILTEIDNSLKRLGTDYVDLYQIHRWDYETPIEETMEVLHDVVKAGKARYIGASAMFAWQFQKALHVAEKHGWTRFVSMHSESRLVHVQAEALYREHAAKENYEFELKHKQIIDRFGRYPHRNRILGRVSSAEEIEFLKQPGSKF